jgi:hypothetical protein
LLFFVFSLFFPAAAGAQDVVSSRKIITAALSEKGIPYTNGFLFAENDYAGGSSILVRFSGNSEKTFVLALPLESGNDSLAFGSRTALVFIDRILAAQVPADQMEIDILVAFLGERDLEEARKSGEQDLFTMDNLPEDTEHTIFWYMTIDQSPGALFIDHGSDEGIAPLNMLQPLWKLCGNLKIPVKLLHPDNSLFALHLTPGNPMLTFLKKQEIDGLSISASTVSGETGTAITEDNLADLLVLYCTSDSLFPDQRDYHYLLLPLPERLIFVPGGPVLWALTGAAAVYVMILLILHSQGKRVIKKIPKLRMAGWFGIAGSIILSMLTFLALYKDINLAPPCITALIFMLFGRIFKRSIPVYICALLSPLGLVLMLLRSNWTSLGKAIASGFPLSIFILILMLLSPVCLLCRGIMLKYLPAKDKDESAA